MTDPERPPVDPLREARERLLDAISGERRDWHTVEVRPDDIAALIASPAAPRPEGQPETWQHAPRCLWQQGAGECSCGLSRYRAALDPEALASAATPRPEGLCGAEAREGSIWTCVLPPHAGITNAHHFWHPDVLARLSDTGERP